jgi:4-hydroxy-tetrahydrodipicolinate synthase
MATTPPDRRLRDRLRSVVAIPVTPFAPDGQVDDQCYRRLVRFMVDGGITVLTPGGNTGEYYSLSPVERRRVVELTVAAAPDAVVVAGVGLDPATAAADAQAAALAGADAVMVHQPVHPFRSVDGWVAYHRDIARAVPDTGLLPYLKDPRIGSDAVFALAQACPGLVAVKYAVPDPISFAGLVSDTASLDLVWLCGLAEHWAPFFAAGGAVGFTSGLATVDPARSLAMLAALHDGDQTAMRTQWRAIRRFEELRAAAGSQDNVSVVKEALAQRGLAPRSVRPPISEVAPAVRVEIAEILAAWQEDRE